MLLRPDICIPSATPVTAVTAAAHTTAIRHTLTSSTSLALQEFASYLWKLVRFPLNIEYTVRANNMDFISSLPLILAVLRVGSVGWAAAVTCQCQCWWLGPSLLWSHHYYLSPARPACPVSAANTLTPPIHTPPTQLAHTSFTTVTSSIHMIFVGHSDNPSSFCSGLSSMAIAWPLHWADNVGSESNVSRLPSD